MIGIIDYGMGNLTSVARAFRYVGAEVCVVAAPAQKPRVSGWVLPGVGAYAHGMRNLEAAGWTRFLNEEIRERSVPFLGICLGMQLLTATGSEFGETAGLGWIGGRTDRLKAGDFRLPHIGWNNVRTVRPNPIFDGVPPDTDFYFVHSYAVAPDDPGAVTGICDYGGDFAASIGSGRVFGVQFHPEKSGEWGLKILKNFTDLAC